MNTLKRAAAAAEPPPPAPETPAEVKLLGEIRDLLARRS
jgi:large-conductance mechanosensitive channel